MNKQLSGVVQGIGDKYNGSLKVGGEWYGFATKKHDSFKAGDQVTLELASWEAKGKTGFNITSVTLKEKTVEAPKEESKMTSMPRDVLPEAKGRDFDAENRGKVRHGLTVALVPLVAQQIIKVENLKELVNQLVDFVMKGD